MKSERCVKIDFFSIAVKAEKWPLYPFLKRSGSIETLHDNFDGTNDAFLGYPFLKRSGSIETCLLRIDQ